MRFQCFDNFSLILNLSFILFSTENKSMNMGMSTRNDVLCFWKRSQALILVDLDTEASSLLFLGYSNVDKCPIPNWLT